MAITSGTIRASASLGGGAQADYGLTDDGVGMNTVLSAGSSFAFGTTAADKFNMIWHHDFTLGDTEVLTLKFFDGTYQIDAGAVVDMLDFVGGDAEFATLRGIMIVVEGFAVTLNSPATTGIVTLATQINAMTLKPGSYVFIARDADGWAVANTEDALTITSGASGATVKIYVVGHAPTT